MAKHTQSEAHKPIPPYLPYKTLANTLTGWRVALPSRIDRTVLGSYSGAMQSWTLGTLRYFDLIDTDGHPTEKLKRLVMADGQERQKMLLELLRPGYPFLFKDGFDLSKATAGQLSEKFSDAGAQGDTIRRCVAFFMGMAKDAGLPLSPYLRMRQRRTGNGRRATKRAKQTPPKNATPPIQLGTGAKTPFEVLYDLLDPSEMDDGEQQAVWTLLRYLKRKGD